MTPVGWALLAAVVAVAAAALWWVTRHRQRSAPVLQSATATLRLAGQAGQLLRGGLTEQSAAGTLPLLQDLLGVADLAMFDAAGAVLGGVGAGQHHLADPQLGEAVGRPPRRQLVRLTDCHLVDCGLSQAMLVPVQTAQGTLGVLAVLAGSTVPPPLIRAVDEAARFLGTQLELAELEASRSDLARAEVRALRAQISPHFIYNALTTIAAFVRSDPDRARDLLLEFADFTRYSFRTAGEFTTLADELGNIDRYLTLERARFGDRLQVRVRVAPEVLGVVVPFLAIQPLVENAVRHGLAGRSGIVSLTAENVGADCVVSVEDDGAGMDPDQVGTEPRDGSHVGLANVDDRLRSAFGDDYGLIVETAPEAGTKVILRVPKFAPGVAVSPRPQDGRR